MANIIVHAILLSSTFWYPVLFRFRTHSTHSTMATMTMKKTAFWTSPWRMNVSVCAAAAAAAVVSAAAGTSLGGVCSCPVVGEESIGAAGVGSSSSSSTNSGCESEYNVSVAQA